MSDALRDVAGVKCDFFFLFPSIYLLKNIAPNLLSRTVEIRFLVRLRWCFYLCSFDRCWDLIKFHLDWMHAAVYLVSSNCPICFASLIQLGRIVLYLIYCTGQLVDFNELIQSYFIRLWFEWFQWVISFNRLGLIWLDCIHLVFDFYWFHWPIS